MQAKTQARRGMTVFFNDGSKMVLDFPQQSPNQSAAALKLEDVLKNRYILMEVDSTFVMIPFENVRYVQIYPAPESVPNHTYIKGASLID
jgi:hypothetical protein